MHAYVLFANGDIIVIITCLDIKSKYHNIGTWILLS